MGNRLSKIYTRTGDDGNTGLGDGQRISKCSLRVETYGTVDEINSVIGLVLAEDSLPDDVAQCLTRIQHRLFDLGGELCIPGTTAIEHDDVAELERSLDGFNEELQPLKDFILPGGTRAAALCHQARTVCRRAARCGWKLDGKDQDINPASLKYLNRLSDLLFVIARVLNNRAGRPEPLWEHRSKS